MREIRSPLDGILSPFAAKPPPFTPASLFASGEDGAWYDPSDTTTLFQDAAGTVAVTSDGDPVRLMLDKSGNGNHAVAPSDAARPLYKTSGGLHWLEFDGVDDEVSATISGLGTLSSVSYGFNPLVDTTYIVASGDDFTKYLTVAIQGSSNTGITSSAGTPTYRQDGAAITYADRNAVYTANYNANHIHVLESVDLSSWTEIGLSDYGGFYLNGKIYGFTVLDRALTTDERSALESYLATKSGVTL